MRGAGFKTVSGSGALIRALDADRARSWKEEARRAERVEYQSSVWSDRENVMVQAGRDQAVSGVVVVVVPVTEEAVVELGKWVSRVQVWVVKVVAISCLFESTGRISTWL